MKGIRLTKTMCPGWEAGAVVFVHDDATADRLISEGSATPYRIPDRPHAVEATTASIEPAAAVRPAQTYKTKRVA